MILSKKLISILFVTSILMIAGCTQNKPVEEDPEIFQVTETEFYAALAFTNNPFYNFRQTNNSTTVTNEVNASRELVYTEFNEYCKTFYQREYHNCYMYDWKPEESIYHKYNCGPENENDGYAINTIPYYTKAYDNDGSKHPFIYSEFEYKEDIKAYYVELPEYSSVGGTPVRRVYYHFKYKKLMNLEYRVYMDQNDWQDRVITVTYEGAWDFTMRGIQYIDKGNIEDNY